MASQLLRPEGRPVSPFEDATSLLGDPSGLRRQAHELGYLYFQGLLPDSVAMRVRRVVRDFGARCGWVESDASNPPEVLARHGAAMAGRGWDDPQWVQLQNELREQDDFQALGNHDSIAQVLRTLYGEPAALATANYCWIKLPGSPEHTTRPHQDGFYLPRCPRLYTVWVPLVTTPFEVGPLAVVAGSHRDGLWPHESAMVGIEVSRDVPWTSGPVRPGDVVFFPALTVHCAWSNISDRLVRVSLDLRYEPASVGEHSILRPGTEVPVSAGEP
jgi:ectoine hydroxylase-related dioxygenase (phytanoyl-CoA dioxygenase family)